MLADFYIHTLSNDMKIAVQINHLGEQILYRSLDPPKNIYVFSKKNFVCVFCFLEFFLLYLSIKKLLKNKIKFKKNNDEI